MDPSPIPDLSRVPGFLAPAAARLLDDLARRQSADGIAGDMAEIGVFYGRTTLVLGRARAAGERVVACDRFDVAWDGIPGWSFPPSGPPEEFVRAAWREHVGDPEGLVVRRADSAALIPADLGRTPRIIHVDGGHAYDDVRRDLALADAALAPAGVVVLDDLLLPEWPDVTVAIVDGLRAARARLVPFLVAEHKGFACRPAERARYAAWAEAAVPRLYPAPGHLLAERTFVGEPVRVVSGLGPT